MAEVLASTTSTNEVKSWRRFFSGVMVMVFSPFLSLTGKLVGQRVGKAVEALGQPEGPVADGDAVEAVGGEALPGQPEQAETPEDVVQRLALAESADIVQSGVEGVALALIALQTASGLPVGLEHQDAPPRLCQLVGTDQSAESASYNDDIIHIYDLRLTIFD